MGHDVLTTLEAGNANKGVSDEEVLAFAISEKRVVLTLNRGDFIQLHRLNQAHFGIIVCTENKNYPEITAIIHRVLAENNWDISGKLIRIYRPN